MVFENIEVIYGYKLDLPTLLMAVKQINKNLCNFKQKKNIHDLN